MCRETMLMLVLMPTLVLGAGAGSGAAGLSIAVADSRPRVNLSVGLSVSCDHQSPLALMRAARFLRILANKQIAPLPSSQERRRGQFQAEPVLTAQEAADAEEKREEEERERAALQREKVCSFARLVTSGVSFNLLDDWLTA